MTRSFQKLPRRFAYWLALLPISLGICIPAQAMEFGLAERLHAAATSHLGATNDVSTSDIICVDEEPISPTSITSSSEKHRHKKKILPRRNRSAGKRGLSLQVARPSQQASEQLALPSFEPCRFAQDLIRTRTSRTRHNGFGGHLIS